MSVSALRTIKIFENELGINISVSYVKRMN